MHDHKGDNKLEIKCVKCEFKTQEKIKFILHMETHGPINKPLGEKVDSRSHENSYICKWFQEGRCRFGDRCWNIHAQCSAQPPQCKFKSMCNEMSFVLDLHSET